MHDILKNHYPYNEMDYDSEFITRKVINAIREFCELHPDVKAFYAKGSLAHGCMIVGSDIDHVRIRTNRCLEMDEKIRLVDDLEDAVRPLGVTQLRRIRDNDYIRVFDRWDLLSHMPNAKSHDFEIWPNLKIVCAKDREDWQKQLYEIGGLYYEIWKEKMHDRLRSMPYNVFNEQVNIDNYSHYSFVNEISDRYQRDRFDMPFIYAEHGTCPVHPDTMTDLGISLKEVIFYRTVYPTSSFRTVYEPEWNVFLKVPVFRKITRGIRDLPAIELDRSEEAKKLLSTLHMGGFSFLNETCYRSVKPENNYITRHLPEEKLYPWFFAIKSQCLPRQSMINICKNIIVSWLYYAAAGIYLEFHTQNILFDEDENICYRDLSDVRTMEGVCAPTYLDRITKPEMASIIFDRTVCSQNLDHVFRYDTKLGDEGKAELKEFMRETIESYKIDFPSGYSMDFPTIKTERVPKRVQLTEWRTE